MTDKQVIFGFEDRPIADTKPADIQTDTKEQPKDALGEPKPTKGQNHKPRSKASNLGVPVDMKQIVNTPVPNILPSTLPNQPVVANGMEKTAVPTEDALPATRLLPNASTNPATKHPAVMTDLNADKIKTYKPELTHPAVLKETKSKKSKKNTKTKKSYKIKKSIRKLDFKQRLAIKHAAAAKALEETANKQDKKSIKRKSIKKTSKEDETKKQQGNVLF